MNMQRPANIQRPAQTPARAGAFNGQRDGAKAAQFSNRGAQSRNVQAQRPAAGGGGRAAAGARAGGGGGAHARGGR
jgi:hypothetical protein